MENVTVNIYNGWEIQVKPEQHQCANYSFSVTSPQGKVQHVLYGGENAKRALERAREFVDLELAFADGQ